MKAHLPFTEEELAWREEHMEPPARISAAQRERLLGETVGDFPLHGFDISSYQPAGPDFRAGGRSFGIFKATEGTGYFDPHFGANRAAAHREGCQAVGLYHFARPGSHTPDAEAAYFLGHVGTRQADEFAVLDYEVPPWSEAWIVRYLQILEGAGWRVAFYSYAGMISANPTGSIVGATPHLWIAAYGRTAPGSDRWPHWTLWQHTDGSGSVGGNDGPWDCSAAVPALLDQLSQAQPGPTPTPTPTPTPAPGHWTMEEPVSHPDRVPADGRSYSIPVPPPHAGGCQGGYGNVWLSVSYDDAGEGTVQDTIPARIVAVKFDGSVVSVFGGDAENVPVPRSRIAAALADGVASVSIVNKAPSRADGSQGPPISVMIEAETRGVPAS